MISGEVRFEGFDVRSWTNLLSLFMPGMEERLHRQPPETDDPVAPADHGIREGTLIVIDDLDGRVLSAQHSLRGRIDELASEPVPAPDELCERYGAHRCVVLREGVMEELSERLALRFLLSDGYGAQWIMLLRAMRELMDAGQIRLWPNPVANVPIPSAPTVARALDLALPVDRAAVFVLWQGDDMWTAAAIRRGRDGVDLVAGPDLIKRWSGPLGGDWRRDYRVVSDAVARGVAPVHLGVFAEAQTLRGLLRSSNPGAWASEVALRNVVFSPLPSAYGVALGADALRGVGRVSAQLLGGLDIVGSLLPLAQRIRAQVTEATTISEVLGFDPLQVLSLILRRGYQDSEAEDHAPPDP